MKKVNIKKIVCIIMVMVAVAALFAVPAFAADATGDVAGAIESTWTASKDQIKKVVNKVVFPAIDVILVVALFVVLGTRFFSYKKTGSIEWTAPIILFASLIFTLTAPLYIWTVIGM